MPDAHLALEIISALATVSWVIVGLLIRSSLGDIRLTQANDKSELMTHQNQVKDDLLKQHMELLTGQIQLSRDFESKHFENKQTIAVHTAQDEERFEGISRTLTRIDGKLDKIANGNH